MTDAMTEKKEEFQAESPGQLKSISIIMTSTDEKLISRVAREFHVFSADHAVKREFIQNIPCEEASQTTRKSPCGNGTATFKRYKLRVYKRLFNLSLYDKGITSIVQFLCKSPVQVQLQAH